MKRIIAFIVSLFLCFSSAYAQLISSDIRTLLSSEGKVVYGEEPNSIMVMDYPDNLDQIGKYLEILDVSPQQVLIEARVVEVTLKDEHVLGINWNLLASQEGLKVGGYRLTSNGTDIAQALPFFSARATPGDTTTSAVDPFTLMISSNDITAVMKALSSTLDTNLLSAPRVTTVNNRSADISIVQKYPWAEPELTTSGDSGTTSITWAVNWEEIGIILKVTPVINPDGNISMVLNPDISELTSNKELTITSGGRDLTYEIPVIDKRSASTKVIVADGQTIILGGLIKDRLQKGNYKVPFMGDLPVVGRLFKNSRNFKEKTELLILVSPRIVTSEVMSKMAKEVRYGSESWYADEKERQEKMAMVMENKENIRKQKLSSEWDYLVKKHKELLEETKNLEKAVLAEENNVKELEQAKAAVITRRQNLIGK